MHSVTMKLLGFFVSLFILITVISQVYLVFNNPFKTETAVSYTAYNKKSVKGIFVWDEKSIPFNSDGIIYYPNEDGSKVAKNSVIAEIYNSENDIYVNKQIEELKEEISLLQHSQNPGTTEAAQPEFISSLIQEKYLSLSTSIYDKNFQNIDSYRNNILSLLNIMQIIKDPGVNYNDRILYLNETIDSLNQSKVSPASTVTTENPGYFVSYTDGYETALTFESITSITLNNVNDIINKDDLPSESNTLGKIINGYVWKFICPIDNTDKFINTGDTVTLNIPNCPDSITATVEDIIDTGEKDSLVILKSDTLNSYIVQHRVQRIDIIKNEYRGVKIPADAIRFKNGEKGVYIKLGQSVEFKKVDIIYQTKDFIISKPVSNTNFVSVYDEIILEGVSIDNATRN